jgi:large subunit ribosomal protein L25
LIPGVIYGHKEVTESVTVNLTDLQTVLRHHSRTLDIEEKGKKETVLIQEIQHDHLGKAILHIDFRRISADESVTVVVPVELRGIAPGTSAGVLDQPLHTLHVKCPALKVPEVIRVTIDKLQLGQAIHVKELVLPEGVTVLEDKDAVVVQVKLHKVEAATSTLPGEGTAEPEVITAKKKVDETEE